MYDQYFNVRIDGCLFGIWQVTGTIDAEWRYEPVDRSSDNKYTPEINAKIEAILKLLNKCQDYAGLTPQQFVQSLLQP